MSKASQFREMDSKKIHHRILLLGQDLLNLRMRLGADTGIKTHRFSLIRREIARLKTVLAEKRKEV